MWWMKKASLDYRDSVLVWCKSDCKGLTISDTTIYYKQRKRTRIERDSRRQSILHKMYWNWACSNFSRTGAKKTTAGHIRPYWCHTIAKIYHNTTRLSWSYKGGRSMRPLNRWINWVWKEHLKQASLMDGYQQDNYVIIHRDTRNLLWLDNLNSGHWYYEFVERKRNYIGTVKYKNSCLKNVNGRKTRPRSRQRQ